MRGWAMGRKGRVQKIDDAGVLIDDITNSSAAHALVSITDIKKYIMVGDFVSVISGGNIGFDGWCLETKDGVALVSERGTCKEVSNLSSQHVPRSRS
jgi:ribosomal protein L24